MLNQMIRVAPTSITATTRIDRYGANACPWFAAILYAYLQNVPLYHDCTDQCDRWGDTAAHRLLLQYATPAPAGTAYSSLSIDPMDGWMSGMVNRLMDMDLIHRLPLPDLLHQTPLKQHFFAEFNTKAVNKKWCRPADKYIAIHVRLGDMRRRSNGIHQKFIGRAQLVDLIQTIAARFPGHNIYLITYPGAIDRQLCENLAKKAGVDCTVQGNDDVDHDLWLMMCSDILILSRSTFSFVAGLLHQGSAVFTYERWSHFNEIVGACHPASNGANLSKIFKELRLDKQRKIGL